MLRRMFQRLFAKRFSTLINKTHQPRSPFHSAKRNFLRIESLEDRSLLAAVSTDQPDYAPGSTALITASGFQIGESIQINITSDTPGPGQGSWTVTDGIADGSSADLDGAADGSITTSWLVDPEGAYAGATLLVTATGLTSGETASTTFTDGTLTGVSVDSQVGTATYGTSSSVTFAIDVTGNGGNPRNWSLSVSGLPTGVSGSFSPASGSGFGGPNDSTLTLSTTDTGANRTLPGTFSFTVTATAVGGTVGGPFSATGTLIVDKRGLTVSGITANSKTYDGNTTASLNTGSATLIGVIGGDSVSLTTAGATGTFNNKKVGTAKPVTIAGLGLSGSEAGRYTLAQPSATADITPKAIIGSFTAASRVYDGSNSAIITSRTLSGVIPGDTVNYTGGAATFSDKNVGMNKTVNGTGFGLGGADASNYTVNSTATALATISAAPLDIFATTDTKPYDGTTSSSAAPTYSGIQPGDSVTGLGQAFDSPNAGPRTLSVTAYTVNDGNSSNNYSVNAHPAGGTISKANATINVIGYSVTYDANAHTATGTATGVLGENLAGLDLSGTTHTDAATYTDPWTFTDVTGNYNDANGTVSDSIDQRDLIVTANANSKTYGQTAVDTGTISGVQGADGITASFSSPGDVATASVAGSPYTISATLSDPNGKLGNYVVHETTASLTVSKATPTINVTGYSVTYDAAAHTATGSATGVFGEPLSGLDLSGTTHTNAGAYNDTWTFADVTGNYNDSSGIVDDSIAQRDLLVTASPNSKTYGQTAVDTGNISGVQGSDGITASFTSPGDAATAPVAGSPYTISATLNDPNGKLANYVVHATTALLTVSKANPTINVTGYSVTYDTAAHTATGSATGVFGEPLAGLNLGGTTHTNAGTYTDTWTFTDVTGNYNNASGTVTDSIGKATLTGLATTQDALNIAKQGSLVISINNITGLQGTDSLATVLSTAQFSLKFKISATDTRLYTFAPTVKIDTHGDANPANDTVIVTYSLRDGGDAGQLAADLLALDAADGTASTSASNAAVDAFFVNFTSDNYNFCDDVLTRLFNSKK